MSIQLKNKRSVIVTMALPLVMSLLTVSPARAQGDDFGIWYDLDIEKRVNNKFDIDFSLGHRSRENHQVADRLNAGIGASYKLTEWLKVSADYSFLYDHNHKVNDSGKKYSDFWGLRHRVSVSLTASQQFGRLGISLRERWQYTYRPEKTVDRYWNYTDDDEDIYYGEQVLKRGTPQTHTYLGKAKSKWRNRVQLKYKLNKQWRPYVNAESTIGGSGLDKIRYAAGTEWRVTKQHVLDLHYMYQHSYKDDDSEGNRHVLGFGYTFKF